LHPLFATRGVPGTHDVALGLSTIGGLLSLHEGRVVPLPSFDKAMDTRRPEDQWRRQQAPVDSVLFEGWCVGAVPEDEAALRDPVNAAGGIQYLASLLLMQSYGAYAVLLEDEFGWSKTVLAGAFAMTRVESGILGPLQGWLADRFGPRMILRVGTVLFGAGFLMFSQVTTLVGFYVTFLIIALGASLGGFATLMVSLVNWFDRHRSKAVAISQTGFALGGFSVPLVVLLLQSYGWRNTALISGVIVMVVGLPLAQVVRHRPADVGAEPDGGAPPSPEARAASIGFRDFTAREAMRTRAFWLVSAGHGRGRR
jgi:MFS family permease